MLKIIGKILIVLIIVIFLAVVSGLLFLWFYPSVGKLPDEQEKKVFAEKTALYYDGSFHNENEVSVMTGEGYPSSPRRKPKTNIVAETPELLYEADEDSLTYTWIGHSSFLLQLGSKNILADPVLGKTSSPVSFAGPHRFSNVPITAEEMPEIDILLLSHDHYDHMDYGTVKDVRSKVKLFVVPLGVESILRGWGVDNDRICALGWWESTEIDGTIVTLTPSRHFTGRNPLKGNSTFWGGYFIDNGKHKVYYTGDGGYYDIFGRVREKLGAPDLMIAECGQYDPAWAEIHMFPEETVQAAQDAGAKWLIPVHWGTFCICNHAWDDPIIRVTEKASEEGINIATPRIGQTVEYEHIDSFNEPWWEEYD
jgi:L-ascorbate metabolism protein UlaG (beta-lactamase superfamily)